MRLVERANPIGRLAATLVMVTPLIFTLDRVSATVSLVLSLGLLLLDGLRWRTLWKALLPVLVVVPFSGLSMLLYAKPEGHVYAHVLAATISDSSIRLAVASMLRTLAMTVPVLCVFLTIDPTELADSLAQILRLPARLVLGSYAGLRMMGLFVADWRALEQARRARGLGDSGRLRRWASMSFALLVFALRRGSKLATAMEARGFGREARTWARPVRLTAADAALVMVGTVVPVVALSVAAWTGELNTFWG